jgi:hypothetical protein
MQMKAYRFEKAFSKDSLRPEREDSELEDKGMQ